MKTKGILVVLFDESQALADACASGYLTSLIESCLRQSFSCRVGKLSGIGGAPQDMRAGYVTREREADAPVRG